MGKKALAEIIGTFWLTFAGCGSVVFWGGVDQTGVSLAFGLSVVTMAYAIGHVSGCHLNPAVTLGLVVGGRFPAKDAPVYIIAQCIGGVIAGGLLFFLAHEIKPNAAIDALGSNGWSAGLVGSAVAEVVLTFIFLMVILGCTAKKATPQMAGLVIGLCLTLIHLVGIPLTGVSVNPARSLGPAIFAGGTALSQLWLFLVAPPIGAALAGVVHRIVDNSDD
jgi:aquaporin Z